MSPSPRRVKTPANLSETVHQRLNMYALAASTAGVGMLALAQPSEAEIVYRPIVVHIRPNTRYNVNLGLGSVPLFTLFNGRHIDSHSICRGDLGAGRGAGTLAGSLTSSFVSSLYALRPGARIGPQLKFQGANMVLVGGQYSYYFGQWINVTNRYLGVRFQVNGQFHYGWARLNVRVVRETCTIHATLTGYAYETIPNKPIIAGKTRGPGEIGSVEQLSPASVATPIPEPATLGLLAMGSPALSIWRRKESVGARQ